MGENERASECRWVHEIVVGGEMVELMSVGL